MADDPVIFLTLVGSLRKDSFNAALARTLPELAPPGVTIKAGPPVGDIPLYNADVQDEQGFPDRVTAIAEAVRAADGVIFVTPEYNYSVPGVLKNAIDWVSRVKDQPFQGKPCAIQSCSQGAMGGVRAQLHLRGVFVFLRAVGFTAPEVLVTFSRDKFADGRLKDEATREVVVKQLEAFAAFVRRLR